MLTPLNAHDFDTVYALLTAAFPVDELRPEHVQRALLDNPKFTAYVTEDLGAVLTLWKFDRFAFIEHFAVSSALRNQGLGSKLLREIAKMVELPVCLEAELPETELARRRLDFYRRNGFTVNPYPYTQPAYAPDRRSLPMYLLTSGGGVTESEFAAIRDTLYKEVYGVTSK